MGDGGRNTRLKYLDEAVKHLQEQSTSHSKSFESNAKSFESFNVTLQDIMSQLASAFCLADATTLKDAIIGAPIPPPFLVLGRSSMAHDHHHSSSNPFLLLPLHLLLTHFLHNTL
ncbi:hypothetical protein H5410_045316 [Solanum commersonii]|uniref:Uncharacterized protein n=1 Tax=Solanum commersonii TaxID=4109 RepID=A0A9J5XAS1_SOLCO|nr:hypothetical protein H5410_045316 [Solanum commersonii]